ncbi:MAG: phosphoglucosamine mutase [Planctomycetaceae bacterium]|nr:phosphoglucosamine mutase [Planctomycetaceae bacterium]
MSAPLIISVSGLRGVVGKSLTPEVAQRYVAALASVAPPGPIVVTRDGRTHGAMLAEIVAAALTAAGRTVLDAGVAATPTTGVLVRQHDAAGGVQISASHNPPEYNGLKLFNAAGRVIPAAVGERVLARYHELEAAAGGPVGLVYWRVLAQYRELEAAGATADTSALVESIADPIDRHLELVAAACDVDRIRRKRFRVVLDANHGSGSVLGRPLLEHLGCDVTVLGGEPDGLFSHPPEPTEANLQTVLASVVGSSAAVGYCQDPDADRLALIDERGRYIGEEATLALCADHVLANQRQGPVVTNCSTSRMTEDLAAKHGVPFFRSKVGEANVVDEMLARNAVLGGEGNGGVIDPRVGLVRDSFVGMALTLDALAASDQPLSALADALPQYAIHKTTIAVAQDRVPAALDALQAALPEAAADRLDGLRLDWPDGAWLLVRPSNTEPIVRAIAEARTGQQARELCERAAAVIASLAN